jgi:hypothetical protein
MFMFVSGFNYQETELLWWQYSLMGIQLNKENPISECMERNGTKQNYSA